MAAQEVKTFVDIFTTAMNNTNLPVSDTTTLNRVKRLVNMVLTQEIAPHKNWYWLQKRSTIRHKQKYTTGTISITNASTAATLSTGPATTVGDVGSFLEYYIKINGFDEIYRISAHTAEATAVTLETAFLGTTNTTASYRIWRPFEELPTDCAEVMEVWIDRGTRRPLAGIGPQDFHKLRRLSPYTEGHPEVFSQYDHHDPTPGTAETEADRVRKLFLYPAINTEDVTINLLWRQEAAALDADADEPLVPIEDRNVLVLGTEWLIWDKLMRNPEQAQLAFGAFNRKLTSMSGRTEAATDTPKLAVNSSYLLFKRTRIRR